MYVQGYKRIGIKCMQGYKRMSHQNYKSIQNKEMDRLNMLDI